MHTAVQHRERSHGRAPGSFDEEAPSPERALLLLQHQVGNRVTSALLDTVRAGDAPPGLGAGAQPVQRLVAQRDDDPPAAAERVKQEAIAKASQQPTATTVPELATSRDEQDMKLLVRAEGPRLGESPAAVADIEAGVGDVAVDYNETVLALRSADDEDRGERAGDGKDDPEEEPEPDLSALEDVVSVLHPPDRDGEGEPGGGADPPVLTADSVEAELDESEPYFQHAFQETGLAAQIAGESGRPRDGDGKIKGLLVEGENKRKRAQQLLSDLPTVPTNQATVPTNHPTPAPAGVSSTSAPPSTATRTGKTTFFDVVGHTRDRVGPGIEASPTAAGSAAMLLEPVALPKKDSPFNVHGQHQSDGATQAFAAAAGVTASVNALGGLATIGMGFKDFLAAWKEHGGRHRLTSKDSRHALGQMGKGAVAVASAVMGLAAAIQSGVGAAASTAASAAGGVLGVAVSFVMSALAFRQSVRASRRRNAALKWERAIHGWKKDVPKKATSKKMQKQDRSFLRRLLTAARSLRLKAGRKANRRFAAGMVAGLSGIGGVFGVMAAVGAAGLANIWNPVGWTIGAIALAGAIGLGVYQLVRRIRRDRNRNKDYDKSKADGGSRTHTSKDETQQWVFNELQCTTGKKHANAAGHERTITKFVVEVLRMKPQKVKDRGPDSIARKWSSW